jgi:hypothetical protein
MFPHNPQSRKAIAATQAPADAAQTIERRRRDPSRHLSVIMPVPPPGAMARHADREGSSATGSELTPWGASTQRNLPAVRAATHTPHPRRVHPAIIAAICVTLGTTATFLTGFAATAEQFAYAFGMAMAVLIALLAADHLMTRRPS